MAAAILPIVGAAGGFMIGGTGGTIIGGVIGSAASNLLFPKRTNKQTFKLPTQEGARLADLRVQLSSYGEVIPKVYSEQARNP